LLDRFGKPVSTDFKNGPILNAGSLGDMSNFPFTHASSGYGTAGASWQKNSLKHWQPHPGDPDADITLNIGPLRARSRHLFMSDPIAGAIIKTLDNYVVGDGLKPQPDVDGKAVGLSKKKTDDMNKLILDEFGLFSEEKRNDWNCQNDLAGNQSVAFLTMLHSGDCPVLLPIKKRPGAEYDLKIRMLESDRVCNPFGWNFQTNILDGIEYSPDWEQTSMHVRQIHPGTVFYPASVVEHFFEWVKVDFFGAKTGRTNALMLIEPERVEQRRGVPILSKVLEIIKQTDRFIHGHVDAAVIQSFFTVFIESEFPAQEMFDSLEDEQRNMLKQFCSRYDIELGSGLVNFLRPGSKVNMAKPDLPSAAFYPFIEAICQIVGACVLVPHEILLHSFKASYSASKAAINAFSLRVDTYRARLAKQLLQPIYEDWFSEAVARGIIKAPRFFDDIRLKKAWTRCHWTGRGMGSMEPLKEANASRESIYVGYSTVQQECAERGIDWRAALEQRGREREAFEAAGLPYPAVASPVAVTERIVDQESDTTEGGSTSTKKKAVNPPGAIE
jgi:lambda family phage portal protein